METAGKMVDDEELRAAMKENGSGRPQPVLPSSRPSSTAITFGKRGRPYGATPTGIELIEGSSAKICLKVPS